MRKKTPKLDPSLVCERCGRVKEFPTNKLCGECREKRAIGLAMGTADPPEDYDKPISYVNHIWENASLGVLDRYGKLTQVMQCMNCYTTRTPEKEDEVCWKSPAIPVEVEADWFRP